MTLELLGKNPGGAAGGNHGSLSRSMASSQEDVDLILGEGTTPRQADNEAGM